MADRARSRGSRSRTLAFAACLGCTVWLVLQNAILLGLVNWGRLAVPLAGVGSLARTLVTWIVEVALIPVAFGLGWLAARRATGAGLRSGGKP